MAEMRRNSRFAHFVSDESPATISQRLDAILDEVRSVQLSFPTPQPQRDFAPFGNQARERELGLELHHDCVVFLAEAVKGLAVVVADLARQIEAPPPAAARRKEAV